MVSCRHCNWRHMRLMKKIKLVGRKISISLLHRGGVQAPIVSAVCPAIFLHFRPATCILCQECCSCVLASHICSRTALHQGDTWTCNGSLMIEFGGPYAHGIVHSNTFQLSPFNSSTPAQHVPCNLTRQVGDISTSTRRSEVPD